ncbi:hypothetical protein FOWG_00036 [Fusarium oxysporum f. sp. lycopersici MN25]|nr:hypothetical protein FOWG_00036 [Fusarium oxysporum f. sp. lycopersici MN25]
MFADSQLERLALLERVFSSISLVSVLLIFVTYGSIPRLRNPRNTFIVFASIANLGASIGTVISRDGLTRGEDSALCRAQSFLVHVFMQSDAWWSLGMSVNTFRIVFFQSNPHTFNKWLYSLICFGGPFISGFTLFFIATPARGPVYGATTTWCWIRESWVSIRLFTSYIFVWICIATSIILNTVVGFRLFRARNEARGILNSRIESTVADHQTVTETNTDTDIQVSEHTSVTAVSDAHKLAPNATNVEPIPPNQKQQSSSSATGSTKSKFWLKDPIKRAYLLTTFMFTLSVLVTWVPASITRIHSLLNRDVPYSYQVAIAAVMPLQGLWNALIFFTTSRGVIRSVIQDKWGLWVSKSTKIDSNLVEREAAARLRVNGHTDTTDSGSDVELHRLAR